MDCVVILDISQYLHRLDKYIDVIEKRHSSDLPDRDLMIRWWLTDKLRRRCSVPLVDKDPLVVPADVKCLLHNLSLREQDKLASVVQLPNYREWVMAELVLRRWDIYIELHAGITGREGNE